jgi:hypothetical protein
VGDDRPRLLHKRSEHGYTDQPHAALPGEPEAIPAELQRAYSAEARQRHDHRLVDEWRVAHRTIIVAVEAFRTSGPSIAPPIWSATGAVLRAADCVDRKLGLR